MSVGMFPGLDNARRTERAEINPLDKSTIVSIYPRVIDEIKPTTQPRRYTIPAGSLEKPATLVVGPASWWKDLGEGQPFIEIPNSSIQVARAFVQDYVNGMLGYSPDSMPGLFFIPGEVSPEDVKKKYMAELIAANTKQREWFSRLVRMADTMWSRSNGNPLAISDQMRLAARELNMNNKPWLADFQTMEMVNCTNCGFLRNPNYPTCPNCKAVIDRVKFETLKLKFAE